MPKVALYNMEGNQIGEVELNEEFFGIEFNHAVVHQVVKGQLANKRQGTKSTLTRAEVRGGGRKPWRQKGTGHARQGSTRAPQWIKGGVTFAPKPRDFRVDIPKKLKRLALKCALSSKVDENQIIVLDTLDIASAKTKDMARVLANLNVGKKALVVMPQVTDSVLRAARNIPNVKTAYVNAINVLDVLNYDHFIITKEAVDMIEEVYA